MEHTEVNDCPHCQGYQEALASHEGLMDYVVLALSKTMDRQEYKIKKLTEEVLKLKNQLRENDDETYYTEGYGGTD
jgi:predicted transcriptional regulator with HTH domain